MPKLAVTTSASAPSSPSRLLSFLVVVCVTLMAEGFEVHVPKGYIYFAMAFSLGVEMLNIKMRKVHKPVKLHKGTLNPK